MFTTAEVIVSAFGDERVKANTTRSEYTPELLLGGKRSTLYLCAPLQEQKRVRPMLSMIVQELVSLRPAFSFH